MAKRCLQAELLAQPWRPHGDVGMEQPRTRHQQGLGAHRCSVNNSNVTNLAWVSKALLPWHQSLLLGLFGVRELSSPPSSSWAEMLPAASPLSLGLRECWLFTEPSHRTQ